ncbi:hypothetical protein Vadar_023370 [Vaccinium darrowii]|uniref:Uncharacterized protein n=1 Tax=Vaccinium darrowii TaxID=229202 RepID=A0ACB7Y8E5_9ERIC|nr:hypothetical protein Vadar_023370 [Vaccinium darrowii]
MVCSSPEVETETEAGGAADGGRHSVQDRRKIMGFEVCPSSRGTSVDSDRLEYLVKDDAQSNMNHSSRLGNHAPPTFGSSPNLATLVVYINGSQVEDRDSMAVHILEAFMDYSNPAAALFRDLGGLDDTISWLKVEISYVENGSKQGCASTAVYSSGCSGSQVGAGE